MPLSSSHGGHLLQSGENSVVRSAYTHSMLVLQLIWFPACVPALPTPPRLQGAFFFHIGCGFILFMRPILHNCVVCLPAPMDQISEVCRTSHGTQAF